MKSHNEIQAGDKNQTDVRASFIIGNNPAKNYTILVKDLNDYARENNIPVIEVFDAVIEDLDNLNNKDYDKNLECFNFKNISKKLKEELIRYLRRVKNTYEKKSSQNKKNKDKQAVENRWAEIEKEIEVSVLNGKSEIDVIERKKLDINQDSILSSKEKKGILRRLAERKMNVEARETAKAQAKHAIEEIQEIVDREFAEGNIESKAMYLRSIESKVRNTDKINREAKEYLLEMIDGRKKEEIYYEQVEYFTNGFEFLSEYPELINATLGSRARKFTDREAYDRFCNLRTQLQDGFSEYSQINNLLKEPKLNNGDKRILEARKSVMDKEIAERREGR